jgi:hypothetical protein
MSRTTYVFPVSGVNGRRDDLRVQAVQRPLRCHASPSFRGVSLADRLAGLAFNLSLRDIPVLFGHFAFEASPLLVEYQIDEYRASQTIRSRLSLRVSGQEAIAVRKLRQRSGPPQSVIRQR